MGDPALFLSLSAMVSSKVPLRDFQAAFALICLSRLGDTVERHGEVK
jgi:hypothetical protein